MAHARRPFYKEARLSGAPLALEVGELLNPDFAAIDAETALETFVEFEADIHRIALREFVKRLGGEPPILLTSADLDE